ncbi:DUF2155 domain-containing protein [Mariprofundus ferrooxydans]|uniref:DUF2155 domain-containing protein n=1 Tax=Mariprofundus ferrooxydans PV-1 TaxID=314345 RepID=Q0F0R6_9PROT|nr:DUF2155 domain-containing protein [Mariprofundus ferrooxydans]EAU54962.1 hypothetical protein SPV1_06454 [Mariprofundus ferrooxydans PV-1]KON48491.1 hypothetical protein AL013_02340 [Mariprofundus ferrooxydans]
MKRISQLSYFALLASVILINGGCEQQKAEKIQWQLPLEAPDDPHAVQSHVTVPDWATARQGDAELVWLQKSTTHLVHTKLALGDAADVEGWHIRLLGLASGLRVKNSTFLDDENVHNPAALVEISRGGKVVYRGWLFQEFPELFGLDDPEWKVWLKGITLRAAAKTEG